MALLARIATSLLLLTACDAGDLSSITWIKNGNLDSTKPPQALFSATETELTGSNYVYSEYSNVVSFKVKPTFHDMSSGKKTEVGFVCGGTHADSYSWGFATGVKTNQAMNTFFSTLGSAEGIGSVSLTADMEIEFKIVDSNVKISICTDGTAASCTEQKSYAMGNLAQPSCMAKIALGTNGAGFEVKEAVTLEITTTTVANTTTAAPTTTTAALTTTATNTTSTTTTSGGSSAVASEAIYASISWMGVFPMTMSIAAVAHIV